MRGCWFNDRCGDLPQSYLATDIWLICNIVRQRQSLISTPTQSSAQRSIEGGAPDIETLTREQISNIQSPVWLRTFR
jgi:hypothetical protein